MAVGTFEEDHITVLDALLRLWFTGFAEVGQIDKFVKNATETPKVRGLIVLFLQEGHFWGPVPPRANVGWESALLLRIAFFILRNFFDDLLLKCIFVYWDELTIKFKWCYWVS
jgi:hypothetical protein